MPLQSRRHGFGVPVKHYNAEVLAARRGQPLRQAVVVSLADRGGVPRANVFQFLTPFDVEHRAFVYRRLGLRRSRGLWRRGVALTHRRPATLRLFPPIYPSIGSTGSRYSYLSARQSHTSDKNSGFMEANVEYALQPDAGAQPRACLAVKLPAEVIRALAEGANASICISTPKGAFSCGLLCVVKDLSQ